MMRAFTEGRLHFAFDDDWNVVKWDRHVAYTGGIHRLPGTKAVDFVGIHHSKPYFIEVTDFREHRIDTKHQLTTDQLVDEVADKVRDTLAGVIWACRRPALDQGDLLVPLVGALVDQRQRSEKAAVIVWLERDAPSSEPELSTLEGRIKQRLRWLNPKVLVTNRSVAERKPLPGLAVTSLPRS